MKDIMKKTILITGSTDGLGFETVKMLVSKDHNVLIHGRNETKLKRVKQELSEIGSDGQIESYLADLSNLSEVNKLTDEIIEKHNKIDVLINNAGVFVSAERLTDDRLDIRFVVNSIAPYLLTQNLLPIMDSTGRVINLSSAAQASVNIKAMTGHTMIMDNDMAYAQSKLALTMWSFDMANKIGDGGPAVVAVNPKSMLGTEMVKQAYGVKGVDISIGANILCKAALSDEFADSSGKYFDNDIGQFSYPHPDALNPTKCQEVVSAIDELLSKLFQ